MLEKFFPDLKIEKIQNIELEFLKKKDIRGLILDIDNTLVPNHVAEADEQVISWIERMKQSGLKVCIVSNASKKRVVRFNERLKLFAIHRAMKPGNKAFLKALRLMDLEPEKTAVVGDQIFTDVYGGKRLNIHTILVTPIHRRESLLVIIKRLPEKIVLMQYKKYLKSIENNPAKS